MGRNESTAGKRVFTVVATSTHKDYKTFNIVYGEHLEPGIPILKNTEAGKVIEKTVTQESVECPHCGSVVRYNDKKEQICQRCSAVLSGKSNRIVRDYNSAGRPTETE